MSRRTLFAVTAVVVAMLVGAPCAFAAGSPESAALLEAQQRAVQPLAIFNGIWRGPASVISPDGKALQITQTERVGGMLGDTIKVIEGRGYAADGSSPFNAFAVISYTPQTEKYHFHSHAQGYAGDFPLEVRPDGFTWSVPAGPAILRYTATVKDGVWSEIGERLMESRPPVTVFEMALQRVGDTDWPLAGVVPAK